MEIITLLIAAGCWALFDLERKLLVRSNPPEFVSFAFSLLVLPCYLVMGWYYFESWPSSRYYIPAALSALFASIGAVAFVNALSKGKISVLIPVLAITPVLSIVFSELILGERLPLVVVILVLMMSFAVHRLLGSSGALSEPGSLSMLLCATSWSLCIVLDKAALEYASAWYHGAWLNASVVVLLGLLCLVRGYGFKFVGSRRHWLLGAICFLFAVLCQLIALQTLSPGVVEATKRAFGTLISLAVGVWLFGEHIKREQLFYVAILTLCMISLLVLVN